MNDSDESKQDKKYTRNTTFGAYNLHDMYIIVISLWLKRLAYDSFIILDRLAINLLHPKSQTVSEVFKCIAVLSSVEILCTKTERAYFFRGNEEVTR